MYSYLHRLSSPAFPSPMLKKHDISSRLASSFSKAFQKPTTNSLHETDVKVSLVPRPKKIGKNKFSLKALSVDNEKSFWAELRDSQPKVGAPSGAAGDKKGKRREARIVETGFGETSLESFSGLSTSSSGSSLGEVAVSSESSLIADQSPVTRFLEPSSGQSVLTLNPPTLALLHDIFRSKHAADVLLLWDSNPEALTDPLVMSVALHRTAKHASKRGPSHQLLIQSDHRLEQLLEEMGQVVITGGTQAAVGPVWMSNVFWALVKLDKLQAIQWSEALVNRMVASFSTSAGVVPLDSVASNLYCLAELHRKNITTLPSYTLGANGKSASPLLELKEVLIQTTIARLGEFHAHELISVSTSLARLGRSERAVITALSDRILADPTAVSVDDLSSILWSLAALKVTDGLLIKRIQQVLETSRARDVYSKRNLVDLVWALAKTGGADPELFQFTFAPLIRSHMMEYSTRELCTILWSYAAAGVNDTDFYSDLCHALIPHVSRMNAHDVSSVAWAFGSVQMGHSELAAAMKHQAVRVKSQFSPLQLARVIYGFGQAGVKDKSVMVELVALAKEKLHLLYTQNLVEILLGLHGSDLLGEAKPFLAAVRTDKVSGRDAVQLLSILGSVQVAFPEESVASDHSELIHQLESIVSARFNCSGKWIPNGYDLVDLLRGLSELGRVGGDNLQLLERVTQHLSTVYKSPSFTPDLFLRFLAAVSQAPPEVKGMVKKLLLLKDKGIQTAVSILTERLVSHADSMTISGAINVVGMFGSVGWQDDSVMRLVERVMEYIGESGTAKGEVGLSEQIEFVTALAEMQIMPDWSFSAAERLTEGIDESVPIESLIDLVWSRLAFGDDPAGIPKSLLARIGELYIDSDRAIPTNHLHAKQVVLSLKQLAENYDGDSVGDWSAFATDMNDLMLNSVSSASRGGPKPALKSVVQSIDKYSSLISHALHQLQVKHRQDCVAIPRAYNVTASISPTVCIDLAGPLDVVAPEGKRFVGEKVLKNIHLMNAGWSLVNVTMDRVQDALEQQSLVPVVADLIAPYNQKGKDRTSFNKRLSGEGVGEGMLGVDPLESVVDDLFAK